MVELHDVSRCVQDCNVANVVELLDLFWCEVKEQVNADFTDFFFYASRLGDAML